MENLHLKNSQNLNPIDIYLNKIEKIYNNNYDFEKLITLLKKLYSHIEKELDQLKLKIQKFNYIDLIFLIIYGIYKNMNLDTPPKMITQL